MEADLFAPVPAPFPWRQPEPGRAAESLTMAQALNRAIRKVLAERPESIVLGQDIATYGGAFKVTEDLYKEFGRSRVLNTPLAESSCTGYAIGLAAQRAPADRGVPVRGLRDRGDDPDHPECGHDALPLGRRLPPGPAPPSGAVGLGSFHSQELESLFLSMPGLKALYPSSPQDAFNALLAANEDNNPVLLFEHKGLYRRGKHPVAWDPGYREIWHPRRVRGGDFATLVTYGETVHLAAEACEYLAAEYGSDIEVFDLRCLSPLDLTEIVASVARTRRLIVLHEGRKTHGFGAEIVAQDHRGPARAAQGPPAADRRPRPARALRAGARGRLPAVEGQGHRDHHGVDVVKRPPISRGTWARMRLFAMDVDGILTDGTVIVSSDGTEAKRFSIVDGLGIAWLHGIGLEVAWISGRVSGATTVRAAELKIAHVIQGRHDKLAALTGLAARLGIALRDCAYMGDDVIDAPAIAAAGIGISVPGALPAALAAADYVTRRLPGHGAVREVCDLLLDAKAPPGGNPRAARRTLSP